MIDSLTKQERLERGVYMTPRWVSESIISFVGVGDSDAVLEPSCGDGSFLEHIPQHIDAIGVEIDPCLAEAARQNTGRRIICGDFRSVPIDFSPTLIIGNPPFKTDLVFSFIGRGYHLLPDDGRLVFLLSTHILQTPSRLEEIAAGWGIEHHIVPRTVFNRAQRPLSLLQLVKGRSFRRGIFLYEQSFFFNCLPGKAKEKLARSGTWRELVAWALVQLGGAAELKSIYDLLGRNLPANNRNKFWQAKIRQVLQLHFKHISRGRWAA